MNETPRPRPALILGFGALCAFLASVPAALAEGSHFDVARTDDQHPERRTVRMRFEATNETDRVLQSTRVVLLLPVAETATQRLLSVEASHPGTLGADARGNETLALDLGPIPPHGKVLATVTATLGIAHAAPDTTPGDPALPGPEAAIEADAAPIRELAQKLRGPDTPRTAKGIYDWIVANVSDSGFTAREKGALFALQHGTGDCSEMAALFVALCRAAGVRARYLGGYVVDASALLAPNGYHNWAEYHDGKTWRVADPQKRVFDDRPDRYVATRIGTVSDPTAGFERFRSDTAGLKVRMLDGR